jgi:predicted phosphodiesterase
MTAPWLTLGDPHGDFSGLRAALDGGPAPGALIVLGDCDLTRPLEAELADAGLDPARTPVWWIAGNHEGDSETWCDNLFASALAEGNLSGRVVEIDGLRVAGLGGVFRGKIWSGGAERRHTSRAAFIQQVPKTQRWRGGLPLRHHGTLWPEDYDALWGQAADVLVVHEAPSCFPTGKPALDALARSMGVRAILHGHHHARYTACLLDGTRVHSLGEAEARWLDPRGDLFV